MLVFTGDINLTDWIFNVGFGIGTNIGRGLDPFKYLEREAGDLWIGNFEGVVSTTSTHKGIYAKSFRVEPKVLQNLKHLDIYGFANNHAMEHGGEAYKETVLALENYGCKVFGLKDRKSIIVEHQRKVISLTGLCLRIEAMREAPLYWYVPEYKEIEEEVASLPVDAFKVLYVHWGNEYINRPSVTQKKYAHWLIDTGFDLVIGVHPHVLQGYEDYHGGRIYYSLGNCVFDMPSEQCKTGAWVGVDLSGSQPKYIEKYLRIDRDGCPHEVSVLEVPQLWRFDYLNQKLGIDDNSEEYHREINKGYLVYRKVNRRKLLYSAIKHPIFFSNILNDFIKRKKQNRICI